MVKRLTIWAVAVIVVVMIPMVADWPWSVSDFVIASVLLFGSALMFEVAARKMRRHSHRLAAGLAVVTGLLLIWVNGAVGIIGNENNGVNMLYFGVVMICFLGSIMVRFEPRGLARVLWVTAGAQFLVPFVALVFSRSSFGQAPGMIGVFFLSSFFAGLFAAAAWLFQQANQPQLQEKAAI